MWDSVLTKFWKVEYCSFQEPSLSFEERVVMEHIKEHHHEDNANKFIVLLPRKPYVAPLGESRCIAVSDSLPGMQVKGR